MSLRFGIVPDARSGKEWVAAVRAAEERQNQDLERHLEQDWDALPPRKGRGRNPRLP